jgi:hypothetical protein
VKSLLREWIVSRGGEVGPGQFQLVVFLPVLGGTATRRDLSYRHIPLYYSERFMAAARMIVVIKDAEGRAHKRLAKSRGGPLIRCLPDALLGPFRHSPQGVMSHSVQSTQRNEQNALEANLSGIIEVSYHCTRNRSLKRKGVNYFRSKGKCIPAK